MDITGLIGIDLAGFRIREVIKILVPEGEDGCSFSNHYFDLKDERLAMDWKIAKGGQGFYTAHILTSDDGLTVHVIAEGSIALMNAETAKEEVIAVAKAVAKNAQDRFKEVEKKYLNRE